MDSPPWVHPLLSGFPIAVLVDDLQPTLQRLREAAREMGFVHVGVAPAVEAAGFAPLVEWVRSGRAGEMDYFSRRLDAYRHPDSVMEGVRTLVVLTLPYPALPAEPSRSGSGRLARYVWSGDDYHDVLHAKMKALSASLRQWAPGCKVRGVVDTAPLLEREFAELAGIGWRGKNTLVINRFSGSYFFLACLLTDLSLPVDEPHSTSHCGTCRRCLDACPTDAFPQPGVLDASRCVSYLTIEHRGVIPVGLREGMGDWIFGCDVCQEVCPWNQPERLRRLGRSDAESGESIVPGDAELQQMDLVELFALDDQEFRRRFRKTPLWRARRRGILRNAAIVLGNQGSVDGMPGLRRGLVDGEPLVRGASAWAIGRVGTDQGRALLEERLPEEDNDYVRVEIQQAIQQRAVENRGS